MLLIWIPAILEVAGAVVGKGFKFGYKQAGDAELLQALGVKAGLKVQILDLVGAATPGVVGTVSFSMYDEITLNEGQHLDI